MSDNHPKLNNHSNRRISEVVSEGFHLFGKNWITLILPLGLFFFFSLIIKNLLVVDLEWQVLTMTPAIEVILGKDPSLLTGGEIELMLKYLILGLSFLFLTNFIPTLFNVVAMCLVSNYLYNKFIGNETKLIPELKNALNGRILLVVLLLGVGSSVGSILFYIPSILIFGSSVGPILSYIPSIFIMGFYIFYIFTYHSDDSDHPIKEARGIAKGAFFKIIGVFIVNYLIILFGEFVYYLLFDDFLTQINSSSWYNPATRSYGRIILHEYLINIIQLLITPLFICLLTSLFVPLKTRKEQYIQYQTSYPEIPQGNETPRIEKVSGSGMYCPFCGKY